MNRCNSLTDASPKDLNPGPEQPPEFAPSEAQGRQHWAEVAATSFSRSHYAEADAAYRQLLILERNDVEAWLGLGRCAQAKGDRDLALSYFQAGALAGPSNPWPRLEAAGVLLEMGQLEAAESICREALVIAPDNAHVHLFCGQRVRARGDRHGALAHFKAAISAEPTNHWAHLEAAGELRELGRLDEAVAAYTEGLALVPGFVAGYLGLGYCARARGDHIAALRHFQEAALVVPDDPQPLLEIALEQYDTGAFDAALETARQVLQAHPNHLEALLRIGLTQRQAGRHEAALASFQTANAAHPNRAQPLVEMAVEERILGRQQDSDAHLAQAVALNPKNIAAFSRLAEQAMMAAKPGLALDIYQRALAANPAEVTFQLGCLDAFAAMGRIDDAEATAAAMEASHGPLPIILAKRIFLARLAGDHHGAQALARKACAAAPDYFWIWSERLQIELLIGSTAEVEAALAALPVHTLHEQAIFESYRGSFAERGWRLREAATHYENAATLNPENAATHLSLTRIRTLLFDLDHARDNLRMFCTLNAPATRLQNRSANLSQTHYGQILDDYMLDRELACDLHDLQTLPAPQRAAALRGVVRANPDHIGAATCLMVALQQAGIFANRCAGAGPEIPRQILQFWDMEVVPADVAQLMQTWRQNNPGHAVYVFNDMEAKAYLAASFAPGVLAAYRRAAAPAQKADLFRLAWLAREGGVYADADNRCLKPVSTLVPADAQLVLYQEDLGTLGNDFIAAVPAHPVIVNALSIAVEAMNRGDNDNIWLSTGPGLITRALAQAVGEGPRGEAVLPPGVVVLHRHRLFQAVARNCIAAYKTTPRNWLNSAFKQQKKKL